MKVTGGLDAMTRRCTAVLLTLTLLATLVGATPRPARAQEEPDPHTGRLVVTVADETGTARGGACALVIDAAGTEQKVCDEDGDSTLLVEGLAAGLAAVKPIQAAAGCAGAFGGEVEVPADGEAALTLTDACEPLAPPAEEKPTEEPKPTNEPEPTAEPKETESPTAPTAEPTETPEEKPTEPPTPTPSPSPSPTPTSTPSPTASPTASPTPPPTPTPRPTTGTLLIALTSATFGTPSLWACYEVLDRATYATLAVGCDGDDGTSDGLTTFANLPHGQIVVLQTSGDPNDNPADSRVTRIAGGKTTSLALTTLPLADLVIVPVAEDGATRLYGACFEVRRAYPGGAAPRASCAQRDGRVVFPDLPAYYWTLVETTAPTVAVPGEVELVLEDSNVSRFPVGPNLTPPGRFRQPYVHVSPAWIYHDVAVDKTVTAIHHLRLGSLTLESVGADYGQPVYGACFRIDGLAGGPVQQCDSDLDGQVVLTGLPVGDYTVTATGNAHTLNYVEYRATEPGAGTWTPTVRIEAGAMDRTVRIGFVRAPSFFVTNFHPDTQLPLAGACYTVYEEAANGVRTAIDQGCVRPYNTFRPYGEVGLLVPRAGRYVVVQTTTPSGYTTPPEQWIDVIASNGPPTQWMLFYPYRS